MLIFLSTGRGKQQTKLEQVQVKALERRDAGPTGYQRAVVSRSSAGGGGGSGTASLYFQFSQTPSSLTHPCKTCSYHLEQLSPTYFANSYWFLKPRLRIFISLRETSREVSKLLSPSKSKLGFHLLCVCFITVLTIHTVCSLLCCLLPHCEILEGSRGYHPQTVILLMSQLLTQGSPAPETITAAHYVGYSSRCYICRGAKPLLLGSLHSEGYRQ